MNKQVVKFLEFRGKNIVYLYKNGTYWIAVKPVCEALRVDFIRQFKNLNDDVILRPRLSKQTILLPGDTQPRKYLCLPEEYIYGWIFSLHSDSEELRKYKAECYHVLYEHFHGIITRRRKLLKEKADITLKRRKLEYILLQNSDYVELSKIKAQEISIGKKIKDVERGELQEELELFTQNEQPEKA
jgi:hypothetical protein